jgi:hypothetical protein
VLTGDRVDRLGIPRSLRNVANAPTPRRYSWIVFGERLVACSITPNSGASTVTSFGADARSIKLGSTGRSIT